MPTALHSLHIVYFSSPIALRQCSGCRLTWVSALPQITTTPETWARPAWCQVQEGNFQTYLSASKHRHLQIQAILMGALPVAETSCKHLQEDIYCELEVLSGFNLKDAAPKHIWVWNGPHANCARSCPNADLSRSCHLDIGASLISYLFELATCGPKSFNRSAHVSGAPQVMRAQSSTPSARPHAGSFIVSYRLYFAVQNRKAPGGGRALSSLFVVATGPLAKMQRHTPLRTVVGTVGPWHPLKIRPYMDGNA